MSSLSQHQTQMVAQRVKPMQIIVGVLILGVLSLCGVLLVINQFAFKPQFDLFCMIGFAFTFPSVFIGLYFKSKVADQAAQNYLQNDKSDEAISDGDVNALLGIHQTHTVISSALIEGPAFFWATVYFISKGNGIGLVMAVLTAGLLVVNVPTLNKLLDWMDRQIQTSKSA